MDSGDRPGSARRDVIPLATRIALAAPRGSIAAVVTGSGRHGIVTMASARRNTLARTSTGTFVWQAQSRIRKFRSATCDRSNSRTFVPPDGKNSVGNCPCEMSGRRSRRNRLEFHPLAAWHAAVAEVLLRHGRKSGADGLDQDDRGHKRPQISSGILAGQSGRPYP